MFKYPLSIKKIPRTHIDLFVTFGNQWLFPPSMFGDLWGPVRVFRSIEMKFSMQVGFVNTNLTKCKI